MPLTGFEGPAGSGKTHQLIEAVCQQLNEAPLEAHQRVLALTFMHGSRKRLEGRLRSLPALGRIAVCMTIDSFARSVLNRWRSLAQHLLLAYDDFDQTCNACGQLLEDRLVATWIAQSFPVVVVDEAQELGPERLRILRALEERVSLFVAADEFQCLDDQLNTQPFIDWFQAGDVTFLERIHRTDQAGLLNAGVALRASRSPQNGAGLEMAYAFRNVMPFRIASALYRCRGSRAVIFAPSGRRWSEEISVRLGQGMRSPAFGEIPPLRLVHEGQSNDAKDQILDEFNRDAENQSTDVLNTLSQVEEAPGWVRLVQSAILNAEQTQGKVTWSFDDLEALIDRKLTVQRGYGYERAVGIPVLSIHQAKNREFDNVVVLWAPGVPGNDEQKARLLYNAITRAKRKCHVFVRTQALLNEAPFRFP